MNKLYRIRKGKFFFGVCGGLAKCFNVDAKMVRLLFTVTVFVFPKIIIAYIILMIVIPNEPKIY
ncbi:PspC domain-containing protein [Holdemanella sp.]|jgi:phage shock protein C|uniref:PspC domain-containing protein n=1 Tax=Holdemanella sp. TaxID=1971762 RepID=UPI002586646F|nr:PspC domain-containing protein [Holdemanella sp.]